MSFFVRLLLVCILCCCVASSGVAQSPDLSHQPQTPQPRSLHTDVDHLLRIGMEHEKDRDWIAAIQHYETALRTHDGHPGLKRRLLISRLHYDVVRRSSDTAIQDMISNVSEAEALELYTEVLARLETSYVEPVMMSEIVRSGTAYLEVALTESGFVDRYLPQQSPAKIEQFRTSIHKLTLAHTVNSRFQASTVVEAAAREARRQLNLPSTATVMQFVFGAVALLDPYSSFLSSDELQEVESQIEGNFVGLGIALQPHETPLRILNVIAGGPAMEAGLQPGDKILEIDSVSCEDVGAERAADLLRGPDRSQVRLLIRNRNNQVVEKRVVRRRVEVPSVENVRLLEPAAGIAYLKISSFQKTTTKELDEALWQLHRQGMQSLIIDVRGNPGGWLDASVAVADRFLTEGSIVSTRGKNGIENQNYSAQRSGTWQVPLTVLIDGDSASASEIFAGAIRDNRRGELVGETTYGKGSVQGLFHTRSLSSGIRLTVSKFYSPSMRAISRQGVKPTIPVGSPTHLVAKGDVSEQLAALSQSGTYTSAKPDALKDDPALSIAIETARSKRLAAQVTRK